MINCALSTTQGQVFMEHMMHTFHSIRYYIHGAKGGNINEVEVFVPALKVPKFIDLSLSKWKLRVSHISVSKASIVFPCWVHASYSLFIGHLQK